MRMRAIREVSLLSKRKRKATLLICGNLCA